MGSCAACAGPNHLVDLNLNTARAASQLQTFTAPQQLMITGGGVAHDARHHGRPWYLATGARTMRWQRLPVLELHPPSPLCLVSRHPLPSPSHMT